MPCGRAAIPVAALLSPRGARPSEGLTVLAGVWGQPSEEPCLPLAHISVAVLVWEYCGGTPPKLPTLQERRGPGRVSSSASGSASLRQEQPWGCAGSRSGLCSGCLHLPPPAPPAARHEQLRLASWESW